MVQKQVEYKQVFFNKSGGDMAKRKRRYTAYKDWTTEEGLTKLEGWAT